jgi:hypothetical protein
MKPVFRLAIKSVLVLSLLWLASKTPAQAVCDPNTCCPTYVCSRDYTSAEFIRQKENGKCVYLCSYTETCTDTSCGQGSYTTTGSFRVRFGPWANNYCEPAPAPNVICPAGEPD